MGIQCNSKEERGEILRNKKKLGEQKIYIYEDLTWREREEIEKSLGEKRER